MSTSNQLTQFWIELLELYKSLPQLWKVSHEGYSHKHSRTTAYEMLLEKYKEFDEGANMDHLKKKIANMRTSFRRESKKVEEDNSYMPMLWYYPHMEFLRDQEDPIDSDDGELFSMRNVKREKFEMKRLSQLIKRKHSHLHAPKRQVQQVNPTKSHHASHIQTRFTSMPDEARTLCATWEVLYRNLKSQQKLYANRVITEVLYLGALCKLNENSYKALDDHSNHAINQQNPINITEDSINYDNDTTDHLTNIDDALSNLKQLENFAVRENSEAIDLIIQLEEMLKNSVNEVVNEEDDPEGEEEEEFDT